jgi:hypothetical protein
MANIKVIRFAAAALLIAVFLVYKTQDMDDFSIFPWGGMMKVPREDLSKEEVSKIRNTFLDTQNIRKSTFASELALKDGTWQATYLSNPTTHLLTQLYSELSSRIHSKATFGSDKYLKAVSYRWDKARTPYAKEYSLFLYELLYQVSGNDDYLSTLLMESEDFIRELDSLPSLGESPAFRKAGMRYPLLRLLTFRYSLDPDLSLPEQKITEYVQELIAAQKEVKIPINEQCSIAWAVAPLLGKSEYSSRELEGEITEIFNSFMHIMHEERAVVRDLSTVIFCLAAFFDLDETVPDISAKDAFEVAFHNYIIHTLNYSLGKKHPAAGGFFHIPVPDSGPVRHARMYLSHNVLMTYLFYRYNSAYGSK